MRTPLKSLIDARLEEREKSLEFRTVRSVPENMIDLASNDYLGLGKSQALYDLFLQYLNDLSPKRLGSSGSRLISGEYQELTHFEEYLKEFYESEAALIFPSGYTANLGLISSLGSLSELTFLYDEFVHASMRDGFRLSRIVAHKFRHNDLEHLKKLLQKSEKNGVVFVESVYSMDGDLAPLRELCDLCDEFGASLIVDEAHSTGIFGSSGRGLVSEQGLSERVYARLHTWGKAHGSEGAVIVGRSELRSYLVNFARPLIYTTGISVPNLIAGKASYALIEAADEARRELFTLIEYFCSRAKQLGMHTGCSSNSGPIQYLLIPRAERLRAFEDLLAEHNIYCVPIFSPTVPVGAERIRVTLHSFNTREDIDKLLEIYSEFIIPTKAAHANSRF